MVTFLFLVLFVVADRLPVLLAADCDEIISEDYPKDRGDELVDNEEFDFIVVGAGSSGSVIASRLSENSNWKILLIEAGGDPNILSDIPPLFLSLQDTDLNWNYRSIESKTACLAMNDRKCPYPRGRALGGSSTIGANLYIRGHQDDFDEWETLGNDGWGYQDVLKYFKRSENLSGYNITKNKHYLHLMYEEPYIGRIVSKRYHKNSGPLSVSPFYSEPSLKDVKQAIFTAVEQLGLSNQEDLNGENQNGFSNVPGTLHQGTRANTAKMFLRPAKNRLNLFVVKNAFVTKLIIKNKSVEGVEYRRNRETGVVFAKKEVIVSAGAINSPLLLLRSGIGPDEYLKWFMTPIVKLKGVGQNFQDHFWFLGVPFTMKGIQSRTTSFFSDLNTMCHALKIGPNTFSSIGLTDLTGFINTVNRGEAPDIQFIFMHFPKNDSYLLPELLWQMNFNNDIVSQYLSMVKESSLMLIIPVVLKPGSRGRVLFSPENIHGPPRIVANILDLSEDVDTLLRGIKFISALTETQSFQTLKAEPMRIFLDECDDFEFESDNYWRCLAKYLTTSFYDPVGTCKMGPKADQYAVVDHELKVHDVKGLRVADASIMPTIIRGNTNAACIMIGEKAADLIKNEWIKKGQWDV